MRFVKLFLLLSLLAMSRPLLANEIRLAVASNFLGPVKAIAQKFETETGERLVISSGSTGKLYAQIINGAPFDLFLAANSREPQRLEDEAKIQPGSRYTYAVGVLALWVPGAMDTDDEQSAFAGAGGQRVAIASPQTAPYGAAAQAVLQNWGVMNTLKGRLIRGENIAQAYQFVATGNAGSGFVALSQLLDPGRAPAGRYWVIDDGLYPPIRQQVVLLKRAADKPAAVAFWRYLKSAPVRAQIMAFGYAIE